MKLSSYIKDIPDFPKDGILFKDINPLFKDPEVWNEVITSLGCWCDEIKPDLIVGIESRGFIVGASLAAVKKIGFIPIRKAGKLPGLTYSTDYELEYGNETIEIQLDSFDQKNKVVIIDDLLATGGTANAATKLCRKAGADIIGYGFIVELTQLMGRKSLDQDLKIKSLVKF